MITDTIRELVFLGLVRVERGKMTLEGVKAPNLFRLTFYADKDGSPATHEWKAVTEDVIAASKAGRRRAKRRALREDIEVPP